MARVSTHHKTLKHLEASKDNGLTLDEIVALGIPRATFFRHRNKIGNVEAVSIEGETRYLLGEKQIVEVKTNNFENEMLVLENNYLKEKNKNLEAELTKLTKIKEAVKFLKNLDII